MDKDTGLIHSKMIAIMRKVGAIDKERDNQAQRYKFRGIDDVYNALHSIMADEGVYCSLNVLEQSQVERTTKSGGAMFYTTAKVEYKFIAEDGSHVTMTPMGEGMDTGDKSNLKSLSNAHKACLLQAFLIPTQDKKDTEDDDYDVEPAKPTITADELIDKMREAKAFKHLVNVWGKHAEAVAKMSDDDKSRCIDVKDSMKRDFAGTKATTDEAEQPDLVDMPDEPPVADPS